MNRLIFFLLFIFFSCSKEDSIDSNSPNSKQEYSAEIAGAIAKGAYKAGSDITFYELNDNLSQTGKSFSTNTTDDYGTFSLSVESLTENYARVEGNGYYWNEITNTITEQKLRLNAICEVNEEINLNILTHLEYDRVIELVQNQGKTFAEAKTQALSEVLSSFGLEYDSSNGNAEAYNFNKADDSSKLLLLVSVAILYNRTQAEISSLISNISNDLKDNGQINENNINKHLIDNLRELKVGVVKVIENEEGEIEHSFSFNLIAQNVYEFYKDSDTEIQISSYDVSTLVDDAIQVLSDELPDQDNDGIPDIYDLCPETPEGEVTNLNGCHDFIYLAENGVTVKARETALIGDKKEINGSEYTVVSEQMLGRMLQSEDDISNVVTTFIVRMQYLLEGRNDFNQDISSWDVSNVVSLRHAFSGLEIFNQDLSFWDVSNVTNMSGMFIEALSFNSDISNWDVSNVTDMSDMFVNAESFNQDLTNWDVSNVLNCVGFNSYAISFEDSNIPNFEWCWTGTVVENNCDEQIYDISNLSDHPLANTRWSISAEEGAIGIGDGDYIWWSLDNDDIYERWCQLDDVFIFHADGSFEVDLGTETWIEVFDADGRIIERGCYTPVTPHTSKSTHFWSADCLTITVEGKGAYIVLPAVHNSGEDGRPEDNTITYNYLLDGNKLEITISGFHVEVPNATWYFRLYKQK
jgi:surface protein